jgi:hypothetical protein
MAILGKIIKIYNETNQGDILIHLDETLFIGEGRNRKCYIHPNDTNLCIKIPTPRGERSANRERRYFKRLHLYSKNMEMISDYKGGVKTDLGNGDIFELIRDSDGNISKNLKYYLELDLDIINKQIIEQIELLRVYLKTEYILISDLGLDNILLQKDGNEKLRLRVIDGIGDNNQVPFLEFVKPLGLKRSAKKWELFKAVIAKISLDIAIKIKSFNT